MTGPEEIGWKRTGLCNEITEPFKPDGDIQLYGDAPIAWVAVPPKHFTSFWSDDAHAPLGVTGELEKLIVKIAV